MSKDEARDRKEAAEAKAKRIERWHQTGGVFESTPELRWLFFELALANGGELDWDDKHRISGGSASSVWAGHSAFNLGSASILRSRSYRIC